MRNLIKQNLGRSLLAAVLGSTLLFGMGGCPEELLGTAVDAFRTGYDIGSGYGDNTWSDETDDGWGTDWDSGWDAGGGDSGQGYGSVGDGYYHNDYLDTSMNSDGESFYIMGDDFSYMSGG